LLKLKIKKMKITFNVTVFFLLCLALSGCKKYDTDYKTYLANHEVTYPGLATGVTYHTGNLRAVLVWHPSPDPSIKNYLVTWNNGSDSVVVTATSHSPADSIKVTIPNLKEYVYTFTIVARDDAGNKSVGQDLNNVRVYGPVYQASLQNRAVNATRPYSYNNDGTVGLNFNKADTGNVTTTVTYTNLLGVSVQKSINPADTIMILKDYKYGAAIQYSSSYIPTADAVDMFSPKPDDFPTIYAITEMDKSLFKQYNLPTDAGSAYGWEKYYLWDKSTNEPGYYSSSQVYPSWFSFDMGAAGSMGKLQIWQRTSDLFNYGNPKVFEVWGTNNPGADGSFSSWTKLATFTSRKPSGLPPGQNTQADADYAAAGEAFTFPPNSPPVRYIRFKILQTWNSQDFFHMLEITLYKQNK
jgi:hypothetical protein